MLWDGCQSSCCPALVFPLSCFTGPIMKTLSGGPLAPPMRISALQDSFTAIMNTPLLPITRPILPDGTSSTERIPSSGTLPSATMLSGIGGKQWPIYIVIILDAETTTIKSTPQSKKPQGSLIQLLHHLMVDVEKKANIISCFSGYDISQ